jgi:PAS domain-containing protein
MADGSLMWIEYSMHPICGKEGEIEYLVAEGRDITERKRAEEALEESRRFFSGTLNNLLTSIGVLEPNGKVIFVNDTPLKAAGIESEDVIGKVLYDIYWWAHSEEARQTIKKDIERCASGESL